MIRMQTENKRGGWIAFKAVHVETATTLREFVTRNAQAVASQVALYCSEAGPDNYEIFQK